MKISFIVPTYNEAKHIEASLLPLRKWRDLGHEVIVVDGGSRDDTLALSQALSDHAFVGPRGRSQQMNVGAQLAKGDVLLFLHADTLLPDDAVDLIVSGMQTSNKQWGRFDVRLSGRQWQLRIVELLMNLRSRLSGIATGDQAIFVSTEVFRQLNGYANIPLMEDIELSKRLKRLSAPLCIKKKLLTSSRRWEQRGIVSTVLLMWRLRLAYFLGVSPEVLARQYS